MPGSILDLRGPEFLVSYIAIGAGVLLLARARMNAGERGEVIARIDLKEPLTIAYLRGGAAEVLRVAAFSGARDGGSQLWAQAGTPHGQSTWGAGSPREVDSRVAEGLDLDGKRKASRSQRRCLYGIAHGDSINHTKFFLETSRCPQFRWITRCTTGSESSNRH